MDHPPAGRGTTYLQEVLGDRAKIYPYGGHCGNMDYSENVAYMLGTMLGYHRRSRALS